MLVCVDVYSRYAFVKSLKTKSAVNVAKKIEELLLEHGVPQKVQSDEGTEFSLIKRRLVPQYGFKVFHAFNCKTKAVHAERFIQTLKQMVQRTLTMLDLGYRYIHYLLLILERYNESPHKGLFDATPHNIYVKGKSPDQFRILKSMLNGSKPTRNLFYTWASVFVCLVLKIMFSKNLVCNVG
jgi:transposase InsO family protein